MERDAVNSRRDDSSAGLVSRSPVENVVLGAHGACAASRARRLEAACPQSADGAHSRAFRRQSAKSEMARATPELLVGGVLSRPRCPAEADRVAGAIAQE